jgi:hypothetical protein
MRRITCKLQLGKEMERFNWPNRKVLRISDEVAQVHGGNVEIT